MFENGFILSIIKERKEIIKVIHNKNSRKRIGHESPKPIQFHWKVLKRETEMGFDGEFVSYFYPDHDIGYGLNNMSVVSHLNSSYIFDIDAQFEDFDNLQIFGDAPLSPYLSFIFFDNEWKPECPNFNYNNSIKYEGLVLAK